MRCSTPPGIDTAFEPFATIKVRLETCDSHLSHAPSTVRASEQAQIAVSKERERRQEVPTHKTLERLAGGAALQPHFVNIRATENWMRGFPRIQSGQGYVSPRVHQIGLLRILARKDRFFCMSKKLIRFELEALWRYLFNNRAELHARDSNTTSCSHWRSVPKNILDGC